MRLLLNTKTLIGSFFFTKVDKFSNSALSKSFLSVTQIKNLLEIENFISRLLSVVAQHVLLCCAKFTVTYVTCIVLDGSKN